MPNTPIAIRFGTDGWRAVIADGYTFDNLTRVARGTADWITDTYGEGSTIVVGNDTRFLGSRFARLAAAAMADAGHRVIISTGFLPTPAVSWATREFGAQAGIVITASHNPPEYNGFKIKGYFGGSALPDMIRAVEQRIPAKFLPRPGAYGGFLEDGRIEERDIRSAYIDMLKDRIDVDAITESGIRIVHDAMYGSGQGVLGEVLGDAHVVEMRCSVNPGFDGTAPEPIERNLEGTGALIVESSCDAGIANDGDADRIGMFDEKGRFVDSHRLLSLLVDYLHRDHGLTGTIVKTVSTTDMLDRMGEDLGLPVETTPIGFKYIGDRILSGDVLVGGEESGGMAVKGHIPERDGLYIGLLILEMMARRGRRLSYLVEDLFRRYGELAYVRSDVRTEPATKKSVLERLNREGGLKEIAGEQVTDVDARDGFKHRTGSGWLLVRPSGTEPVLRIYAEASTKTHAERMVEDALVQLEVR
jgi:phosphomannomutase